MEQRHCPKERTDYSYQESMGGKLILLSFYKAGGENRTQIDPSVVCLRKFGLMGIFAADGSLEQ